MLTYVKNNNKNNQERITTESNIIIVWNIFDLLLQ